MVVARRAAQGVNVGGQVVPVSGNVAPYMAGRWFEPAGADNGNAVVTPNEGRLEVVPIYLPMQALSNLGVWVVTGGAAGALIRFGIFDDVGGVPTNLKLDAGTAAATASTALVSVAAAYTPTYAGWHWFGAVVQGAAASRPSIVHMSNANPRSAIYPAAITPNGFGQGGWFKDGVSGALPDPMAPAGTLGVSGLPTVYGKWA